MDGEEDIDGDEAEQEELVVLVEEEKEVEGSGGGGGVVVVSWKLLAAAAASLWMDLGDKMVSWGWWKKEEEVGKLRLTDLPLRHKRAAS